MSQRDEIIQDILNRLIPKELGIVAIKYDNYFSGRSVFSHKVNGFIKIFSTGKILSLVKGFMRIYEHRSTDNIWKSIPVHSYVKIISDDTFLIDFYNNIQIYNTKLEHLKTLKHITTRKLIDIAPDGRVGIIDQSNDELTLYLYDKFGNQLQTYKF